MSTHPVPYSLIPVRAIKTTLTDDIVLASMTVAARPLQGVYYLQVDQEDSSLGPSIVISGPIYKDDAAQKRPNGPNRVAATFKVPVRIYAQGVRADDDGLNKMLGQVIRLLEGKRIAVDGGEAVSIVVDEETTPRLDDTGGPITSDVGVIFEVDVQTT